LTGAAGFDLMRTLFREAPIGRVLQEGAGDCIRGLLRISKSLFPFLSRRISSPASR